MKRRRAILCGNPLLSNYFSFIMNGMDIDAFSFNEWVYSIANSKSQNHHSLNWTHHIEPTEEEVIQAYDKIEGIYDAVIVDEGQDFKEDWWVLVEESLKDNKVGIFYIFADDNQSLLPRDGSYPFESPKHFLSKNCRNSGDIFNEVRKFHPNAPDVSSFLKETGVYIKTPVSSEKLRNEFDNAVRDAVDIFGVNNIVIITTEYEGPQSSELSNGVIEKKRPWSWSDTVDAQLIKIKKQLSLHLSQIVQEMEKGKKLKNKISDLNVTRSWSCDKLKESLDYIVSLDTPTLSGMISPSEDDKKKVSLFMRSLVECFDLSELYIDDCMSWDYSRDKLFLVKKDRKLLDRKSFMKNKNRIVGGSDIEFKATKEKATHVDVIGKIQLDDRVSFFLMDNWWSRLPELECVNIVPYQDFIMNDNKIPLYDIASFKGLESDAVIVYVKSSRDKLDANLYVAMSRARFYLHLVIEATSYARSERL